MYLNYELIKNLEKVGYLKYNIISKGDNITNQIVYGIAIKRFNANTNDLIEYEYVSNLTYSLKQTKELIQILYNNTVTPCELVYVIDDYISSNNNFIFEEDNGSKFINNQF